MVRRLFSHVVHAFDRASQRLTLTPGEARALALLAGAVAAGALVREIRLAHYLPTGAGITNAAGEAMFDESIRRAFLVPDSMAWAAMSPASSGIRRDALAASVSPALHAPVYEVPDTPVELNGATEAELDRLPGIGPALARRIVDRRKRYGPFQSMDDLLYVSGIGPRTLERLRERAYVDGSAGRDVPPDPAHRRSGSFAAPSPPDSVTSSG